MVAEIWANTSIFAILLLAGLLGIPRDLLKLQVDGCNSWQYLKILPYHF